MNKKIIIISGLVILLCIVSLILINNNKSKKIYLSDEFYGNGIFSEINSDKIDDYSNKTYLLFTYNNYCNLSVPCDEIFSKIMAKYKIDFLSIPYEDFKNTNLHETVEFAPSIIIVNQGEIVAYLDAESDEDIIRYTDASEFEKWLDKYIYFSAKK